MPPRFLALLAIVAAVVAVLLAGCVAGEGRRLAPPTTDAAEPAFSSDEEALQAAVEAYERYRALSYRISSGGAEPEAILDVASERYGADLHESLRSFIAEGLRTKGESTFDSASLTYFAESRGVASVSIYVCRDVSTVAIVTDDGHDITPSDRKARLPLMVGFVSSTTTPTHLLIDSSEVWTGDDFC